MRAMAVRDTPRTQAARDLTEQRVTRARRRRRAGLARLAVVLALPVAVIAFVLSRDRDEPPATPPATTASAASVPASTATPVDRSRQWGVRAVTAKAVPLDSVVLSAGTARPQVALTFDDGPGPSTHEILDILERRQVHATFFVVGAMILERPEVLQKIVARGHVLANHTRTHAAMPTLTVKERRAQLIDTSRLIEEATGRKPRLYRPPYGATTRPINRMARRLHMLPVVWNVESRDWEAGITADQIVRNVLDSPDLGPGAIIIFHDAGGASRAATVEALPRILDALADRGLEPVTVPELLDASPPGPANLERSAPARTDIGQTAP